MRDEATHVHYIATFYGSTAEEARDRAAYFLSLHENRIKDHNALARDLVKNPLERAVERAEYVYQFLLTLEQNHES
jgi:hypothetical protein